LAGKVYTHSKNGFMGAEWDAFVPGPEVWREVYRVLKPGAYCVAFSSTRTVDLLGIAMRLARLEVRPGWAWLQGSGFPKSLNVGKAIDKDAGAEREVVGTKLGRPGMAKDGSNQRTGFDDAFGGVAHGAMSTDITAPATEAARQWEGWGTDTKPAYEPLVVTRKPLEGTVANNVLVHGCGALNIDGARVGTEQTVTLRNGDSGGKGALGRDTRKGAWVNPPGRYPANLALVHDEECRLVGITRVNGSNDKGKPIYVGDRGPSPAKGAEKARVKYGHTDEDGTETVEEWECTPTCAVAELDRQSGFSSDGFHSGHRNLPKTKSTYGEFRLQDEPPHGYGGEGTAARFFYQGKATAQDRLTYLTCSPGCTMHDFVAQEHETQTHCPICRQPRTTYRHPTVKPYELAQYHVKLLSLPPHTLPIAIVPFCGTGIEARALMDVGFRVIAIDIDPRHCAMTTYRMNGEQPVRESPVAATEQPEVDIFDLFTR
jgi:hypothetical protein